MTVASLISSKDALSITRVSLGFPEDVSCTIDVPLIAQALRRAIFESAPCRHHTAKRLVFDALRPFSNEPEQLSSSIEAVLEHLIAMGDFLESSVSDGSSAMMVLRPAPPSFVKRSEEAVVLLGVAGEQITPEVGCPVSYGDSGLRMIQHTDANKICESLREEGLVELKHQYWLYAPPEVTAALFVEEWKSKLPTERFPQVIDDLLVLNTALDVTYYKGRWVPPSKTGSGIFIARRPQRFGADLWVLVELENGSVIRFADIHSRISKVRSCDEAWRIQAALDELAGTPQILNTYTKGEERTLAFHSPIPSWIERRLSVFGEPITLPGSLFSFRFEAKQSEAEIEWLKAIFWMKVLERGAI